jgi:peptide deformylase
MKSLFLLTTVTILFMLSLINCKTDGFTPEEKQQIMEGNEHSIMRLYTIEEKTDSLLLRQKARTVKKKDINSVTMEHFRSRMLATVNDSLDQGVGIAAPQVGISLQMIYVQRLDKQGEPFEIYYNPLIEYYGDSINSGLEGCLSVPSYRGKVDRSQNIVISYLDSLGNKKKEKINDFTAVIFQHEVDHINGILYYDHIYNGFNSLMPVDGY